MYTFGRSGYEPSRLFMLQSLWYPVDIPEQRHKLWSVPIWARRGGLSASFPARSRALADSGRANERAYQLKPNWIYCSPYGNDLLAGAGRGGSDNDGATAICFQEVRLRLALPATRWHLTFSLTPEDKLTFVFGREENLEPAEIERQAVSQTQV